MNINLIFWILIFCTIIVEYNKNLSDFIKFLLKFSLILFKIYILFCINTIVNFMNLSSTNSIFTRIIITFCFVVCLNITNSVFLLFKYVSFCAFYDVLSIAILIVIYKTPVNIVYDLKNKLKVY